MDPKANALRYPLNSTMPIGITSDYGCCYAADKKTVSWTSSNNNIDGKWKDWSPQLH
jgi:hypothetical protein